MDADLEEFVRQRAQNHCEYCRLPAHREWLRFEIDHIIAQKHGGDSFADNLAWSCFHGNSYKGPNIAGLDPLTRRLTPLFHPRRDTWRRHFEWDGPSLIGRTAKARTTIQVLRMNHPRMIRLRAALLGEGERFLSE